ncbi:nudix hydrolase 24, chloroplastic-like [Xenia sp. Carnegie-2017]|uniref:nudix hydrolase 24, chloroplastic-like n=1 Tax=Xenia sp. Carnegie-2017 TaxID=2897299 RepID=UPI001F039042|nr:nudix hydrolase 24, chloroplastic-like [Xenia sp. Carnegie-2017]
MELNDWSSKMLKLVQSLNSFNLQDLSKKKYKPFKVDGVIVGIIPSYVYKELEDYTEVFVVNEKCIQLNDTLTDSYNRTNKINNVLHSLWHEDKFCALKGWRNEMYNVSKSFGEKSLFQMERSAASLFGIMQYGVHINGYKMDKDNNISMWIARRSSTKPTYPGKLDQIAAGGIASNHSILDTLIKECDEEASVPASLARKAVPCGAISYCYEDERGIFPEVEFVYDLKLPDDFHPSVNDGEVEEFYCWPIQTVKEKIVDGEFKPNSAIVILNFMIRHGVIHPDTERNF